VPDRSVRKAPQNAFRTGKSPRKRADGARRIAADLHTVSPTLIFRWKYPLTGKNIPHILQPTKSNTLSIQLVTQRHTGDDTTEIEQKAPKTWKYLMRHKEILDGRKSSIYRDRLRFSVFGIGIYSFAPWKIAISGLYKKISFVVVPPCDERPVMVDDTCYSIPCQSRDEAELLFDLLSSDAALEFINSLVFTDAKRPITIDVLRRLSLVKLAQDLGKLDELQKYVYSEPAREGAASQMLLLIEPRQKYRFG